MCMTCSDMCVILITGECEGWKSKESQVGGVDFTDPRAVSGEVPRWWIYHLGTFFGPKMYLTTPYTTRGGGGFWELGW
jgi:hypothetical protein